MWRSRRFFPNAEGKKTLPVALDFPSDTNRLKITDDELEISIPMPLDPKQLNKYEVFLGLQLSPEELAYNRQKRGQR